VLCVMSCNRDKEIGHLLCDSTLLRGGVPLFVNMGIRFRYVYNIFMIQNILCLYLKIIIEIHSLFRYV
jgi:hypothetical protein